MKCWEVPLTDNGTTGSRETLRAPDCNSRSPDADVMLGEGGVPADLSQQDSLLKWWLQSWGLRESRAWTRLG